MRPDGDEALAVRESLRAALESPHQTPSRHPDGVGTSSTSAASLPERTPNGYGTQMNADGGRYADRARTP